MIDYTIYTTSTGIIHTNGTSSCLNINEILINSEDSILLGTYTQDKYKIISGVAQNYTPNFWNQIRIKRDDLLSKSDWTQTTDSPLTDSKKAEWVTYRQALRDVPSSNSSAGTIDAVTFPTVPS